MAGKLIPPLLCLFWDQEARARHPEPWPQTGDHRQPQGQRHVPALPCLALQNYMRSEWAARVFVPPLWEQEQEKGAVPEMSQ